MAHRARHPVVREQRLVVAVGVDGQMREDLPFLAGRICGGPRHRHVADGAFVLNIGGRGRMIADSDLRPGGDVPRDRTNSEDYRSTK